MAEVEYSSHAADWLRNADSDVQEQVIKRVERAEDFPSHFLTRLSNSPYYKLRAGDYRAIVDGDGTRIRRFSLSERSATVETSTIEIVPMP